MNDDAKRFLNKQTILFIIAIIGLVLSAVIGRLITVVSLLSSMDGGLNFSDFLFFVGMRIVISVVYIVPQILMLNNCKKCKKENNNKLSDYKPIIDETNKISKILISIWTLIIFIAIIRIFCAM